MFTCYSCDTPQPDTHRANACGQEQHERASSFPAPDQLPIQRKVGFEFQTGWQVNKISRETELPVPMTKKENIGTKRFGNFFFSTDDQGAHGYEIEYVVEPPLEEGLPGMIQSNRIAGDMSPLMLGIPGVGAQHQNAPFELPSGMGGNHPQFRYVITAPEDGEEYLARPQITAGISLDALPRFGQHNPPQALSGYFSGIANNFTFLRQHNPDLSEPALGLLLLLNEYFETGRVPNQNERAHHRALGYPKEISNRILARTDFGKIYSMIPNNERPPLHQLLTRTVNPAHENLGDENVIYDSPLFDRGIKENELDKENLNFHVPELTVRQWLTSIVGNDDALKHIENAESLGNLNNRTEGVGPTNNAGVGQIPAPIFELRNGIQTNKVDLTRVSSYMSDAVRYISILNNPDEALPQDLNVHLDDEQGSNCIIC